MHISHTHTRKVLFENEQQGAYLVVRYCEKENWFKVAKANLVRNQKKRKHLPYQGNF